MTRGPDPSVSTLELLSFFAESSDPAFAAKEVANEYDKTRQWGDRRLKEIEEMGYLKSKNPGGRARIYWLTEAGELRLSEEND
jgi:DNA-binding MarR family transcriptional regulator